MSIQLKLNQSEIRFVLKVSDAKYDSQWREFMVSRWFSPRVYRSSLIILAKVIGSA